MANTTQMVITFFDDENIITIINGRCNDIFRKCQMPKPGINEYYLSLTSYGFCVRSLDKEEIENILNLFKNALWQFPQLVTLSIVDDDNNGEYNGVHVIPTY